jgi:hypothetical protein
MNDYLNFREILTTFEKQKIGPCLKEVEAESKNDSPMNTEGL